MENTYSRRDIELEKIHYLAAGNIQFDELLKKFPTWDANELSKIYKSVEWFCWGSPNELDFNIQGTRVTAIFPYEHDEKTMSLVKDMLSKSHAEYHTNTANQQSASESSTS